MRTILFVVLCGLMTIPSYGQFGKKRKGKKVKSPTAYNKKAKEDAKFLEKQWWVGLKAGPNWTSADVLTAYSVIEPTNYDENGLVKTYDNFSGIGTQASLEIAFYFRQYSLLVQPTYQHSIFKYSNSFNWDGSGSNNVELDYNQEQQVDHAVIPILFKYDITSTRLRPYVQAGPYFSFLVNANKSVNVSGTDYASGGANEFSSEPIIVGAKDLFAKNYWGLAAGAGANYQQGNIRLNLDILYQMGMSNAINPEKRYSNDRLSGIGDAMDDLTLNNIVISFGVLFPLRFLENGFQSMDKARK